MDTFSHFRQSMAYAAIAIAAVLFASLPAMAEDESTVTGTVFSSFSRSFTVRTEARDMRRFVLNDREEAGRTLPVGSFVRVISDPPDAAGVRVARVITVLRAATDSKDLGASEPASPQTATQRQSDAERQARRLQLGIRGGVALDPELIVMGVQAQFGPLGSNVFFRPSVEFAYGEITAMFGFNGEFIYRLPMSSPQDRWSPYFGGGLGINLLHQNFDRDSGGQRIDFGDFHSDSALNILGGVRYRSGVFMELRTSIYSDPSPTVRLIVGYSF